MMVNAMSTDVLQCPGQVTQEATDPGPIKLSDILSDLVTQTHATTWMGFQDQRGSFCDMSLSPGPMS